MPIPSPSSEQIRAAIAGDRPALERLLLDHYDPLKERIGPRLSASLQAVVAADDIVQQTFAQVFRDIASYQPQDGATFLDWISAIAENRLRDELRAAKREKRGGAARRISPANDEQAAADLIDSLLADSQTASRAMARREAIAALQVALAQLPASQQEAVRLHFLEGLTIGETAALLNCTSGAVRGLLDRGKDQLRAALGRASLYLSRK